MQVELIPVVEIERFPESLTPPERGPAWQFPAAWDAYHAAALTKAGFPLPLRPIAPGFSLYRATEIPVANLRVLLIDWLADYLAGEEALTDVASFYGGYVLRIEGRNVLYPQCCGELSDIIYWKQLASSAQPMACHGHPAPDVTRTATEIVLTCQDAWEGFVPPVPTPIRLPQTALAAAYAAALVELQTFARHLGEAQRSLNLPVGDLRNLLIFRNDYAPHETP